MASLYSVGTIILVNGTSSSGKSSIINSLKQKLQEDAVFVSIDEIGWTPLLDEAMQRGLISSEMSNKEQYDIMYKNLDTLCAACEHKLIYLEKLYDRIQKLALDHRYVIFDTVFYMSDYQDVALFWERMKSFNVCSILVYCSPEIIVQRVMRRNAEAMDDQKRDLFSVAKSFCLTYSPASNQEDAIAFLKMQDVENLLLSVQKYLHEAGMSESLVREKIAMLSEEYAKRFFYSASQNLPKDELSSVGIVAQFKHDIVINTGLLSSDACAQSMIDLFEAGAFFEKNSLN